MGCSSGNVSSATSINGGLYVKIIDAGRETFASDLVVDMAAFPVCGEGVLVEAGSNLDVVWVRVVVETDADRLRFCFSLSREPDAKADMKENTVKGPIVSNS